MSLVTLLGVALWWALCLVHLAPQWYYLPNYGYGWGVPFLCAYLAAERGADAPKPAPIRAHPNALATALGIAGALFLLVRVVQAANPSWRPLQWASASIAVGVTLILIYRVGGPPWLRHFWFPVAFFLTAVPWRTSFETHLIQDLSRLNAEATVHLLAWVGIAVTQHGNVIETSRGWAGIDEACSGIRSLQATLMLGLFFGELYRLSPGRRLCLFLSGLALALLSNAGRTLTLVWICDQKGLAAMERWHDPTGIALLLSCFTGLWLLGRACQTKTQETKATRGNAPPTIEEPVRSTFQLFSFLAFHRLSLPAWTGPLLVAIPLAIEASTEGWYRYHERDAQPAPTWTVRWPPPRDNWKEVTVPPRSVSILRYQSGRAAAWTSSDGGTWQMYFFIWRGGSIEAQLAANHTPDICLPASGRVLEQQEPARDFAVGDLQLPFQRYVFRDRGRPLYAFHCRWEDVRTRGPRERENWKVASRLDAVRFGRRNVGQRTLEFVARGYPDLAAAEAALQLELSDLILPPP